ncbi:hypothetical protein GGR56DRAFT_298521 [Xylariaceae sp. FL0804]|nr:hypothetical protein GGR56DRAFT_298521 [Xylariaceae sp. FL0804]
MILVILVGVCMSFGVDRGRGVEPTGGRCSVNRLVTAFTFISLFRSKPHSGGYDQGASGQLNYRYPALPLAPSVESKLSSPGDTTGPRLYEYLTNGVFVGVSQY